MAQAPRGSGPRVFGVSLGATCSTYCPHCTQGSFRTWYPATTLQSLTPFAYPRPPTPPPNHALARQWVGRQLSSLTHNQLHAHPPSSLTPRHS